MANLQEEGKRIAAQMANYIRNLELSLAERQVKLREEQEAAQAAAAQGDRSENAEFQIASANIARLVVSISTLTDIIDTYKRTSLCYKPVGKAIVGSTLLVRDESHDAEFPIQLYPAGLGDAKIGAISVLTPLGSAVLNKVAGDSVLVQTPSGDIRYSIKEVY